MKKKLHQNLDNLIEIVLNIICTIHRNHSRRVNNFFAFELYILELKKKS